MSNARIKVHRSTPSNDGALGAQNTTRLTIDRDDQYPSIAVEADVDAPDILSQVMHGITSPSALKDDGLPLSLSDATWNAKNLLIQARTLAKASNEIISSGDWLTVNDMAAITGDRCAFSSPAELLSPECFAITANPCPLMPAKLTCTTLAATSGCRCRKNLLGNRTHVLARRAQPEQFGWLRRRSGEITRR